MCGSVHICCGMTHIIASGSRVLNSIQTAKSSKPADTNNERLNFMLYTIAVVLLILWLLGLVTSYTLGGFIHILLVVAVVMILVNIISGRRAL
jgi:hypothetical protein